MTAEVIIHILLAFSLCAVAFALIWAVQIIGELNNVVKKLFRKIDNLQQNEMKLMEQVQELEKEKARRNTLLPETFAKMLIADAQRRNSVNVVDKDKPLDFPNGD